MTLRRQWWIAGTLVCLTALAAQRARADGASPWPSHPGLAPSGVLVTGQAPVALPRPMALESIDRALRQADALYRSRQSAQALQAYASLVETDAANPQAWLRLGNLHQHAGRDNDALDAYRRAARGRNARPPDAEARGKALLNIALLGIADATRAIDEFDAMDLAALDDTRDAIVGMMDAQRRRGTRTQAGGVSAEPASAVQAAAIQGAGPVTTANPSPATRVSTAAPPPVPGTSTPRPPTPRTSTPVARPAAAPPKAPSNADTFEPFTVDRWIAKARRATGSRTAGRSALSEPVTETPLPPLPVVETFRGGAGGRRP